VIAMSTDNNPAYGSVRYFLNSGTTIVLDLPYAKIGPEKIADGQTVFLTEAEKAKLAAELSKCETEIRAGNLEMLQTTLELCNCCGVPLPGWLLPYLLEALCMLRRINSRTRQKYHQRELHQLRWAAVYHLRFSQSLTWEDAYTAASRDLRRTQARGSEETMRNSYKWMSRHPYVVALRRGDSLPGQLREFARNQYENRQAISERMSALQVRDRERLAYLRKI
jgi:hypothetical protein